MRQGTEAALKAKLMLAQGYAQKKIAQLLGVSAQWVSNVKVGRLHKDVVSPEGSACCVVCANCDTIFFDDGVMSDVIYLVSDDEYLCNAQCEAEYREKDLTAGAGAVE